MTDDSAVPSNPKWTFKEDDSAFPSHLKWTFKEDVPRENFHYLQFSRPDNTLTFYTQGKTILVMKSDGTIELGEGTKPDWASEEFLRCLSLMFPHWLAQPKKEG